MTPLWLALVVSLIAGSPSPQVIEQRQSVDQAAAAVAAARDAGARRQELADLMATYREQAEALEKLERETGPRADDVAKDRLVAQTALAGALAEGDEDPTSRGVLGAWLGDSSGRLDILKSAYSAGVAIDAPELSRDIFLDLMDQCQALILVTSYDAALISMKAARLTVRAANLERRTSPGQGSSMADAVQARRMREEAEVLEVEEASIRLLNAEATVLMETTKTQLELIQ